MPISYDLSCFSSSYFSARDKFITASQQAKGVTRRFNHSLIFEEQTLSTDSCWLGSPDAENVLVLISATHGVEGFCGSAAQVQWLRQQQYLLQDTAVLLIHALNPFGFAHCRRVNEDNVDLNRNFIDFNATPDNAGYEQLAKILVPDTFAELAQGDELLASYRQTYGKTRYESAVSGGQYQFPSGLFYGGTQASWSRQLIETVIVDFSLAQRQGLSVIDFHSGLGPYGYGEIICDHPTHSVSSILAKKWYGDSVTEPNLGTSTSVAKQGLLDYAWYPVIGDNGCFVTLEFGTYSVAEMFKVLRQENYCWHRPVSEQQKLLAQQQLRHFFYPEKRDWKEMILFRSGQVIEQALQGLSS